MTGSPTAVSGLYLAYKEADPAKATEYRQKLEKLGVSADAVTTVIKEGASTASLTEVQPPVITKPAPSPATTQSSAPASTNTVATTTATAPAIAIPTPAPAPEAAPEVATSLTASSAAPTAPTPVTQTPLPGVRSSDAVTTAPGPEDSTSRTR